MSKIIIFGEEPQDKFTVETVAVGDYRDLTGWSGNYGGEGGDSDWASEIDLKMHRDNRKNGGFCSSSEEEEGEAEWWVADGTIRNSIRGTEVAFSYCPFCIEEDTGIGVIYCDAFEIYLLEENPGRNQLLVIDEGVYIRL